MKATEKNQATEKIRKVTSENVTEFYNENNELHNVNDEPAVVFVSGTKMWFKNGKLHREGDMPAVINADGKVEYWENDNRIFKVQPIEKKDPNAPKINVEKINKIIDEYKNITSTNNYAIGGGLSDYSFASKRHEDAKNDNSKITLGKATAKFKACIALETKEVKKMIVDFFPYLEWHHAGALPKNFGGGMKKTYFLTAEQMVRFSKHLIKKF